MTNGSTSAPFDPTSLTWPIDRAQLREFTASTRSRYEATGLRTSFTLWAFVIVAIQISIAVAFLVNGDPVPTAIIVFGPVLIAVVGLVQLLRWLPRRPRRKARFRIARMAQANGWTYVDSIPRPDGSGMIFRTGGRRLSTAVVRIPATRPIEVGNHRYVVDNHEIKSDTKTKLARWGYASMRLDVPLPNIVLRSRGGRLPIPPAAPQQLSLEGDFDQYFTLFCPAGYETDALYLFTPDVCARLIDAASAFDVEIVDDQLYLYDRRDLSTTDAATWTHVLLALAALQDKLDQWARWRDFRLPESVPAPSVQGSMPNAAPAISDALSTPPPGVAAPGRRLRRAFPWVAAVFGILYIVFWIVIQNV